jgi:hypothetical protein
MMVGGWALVAGAFLFAAFWASPALDLDLDLPWLPSLAMHGATIGLLGFGLVAWVPTEPRDTARQVGLVGVVIAIAGLLFLFPLIPLGFLIVGSVAALTRRGTLGGTALSIGAAALLAAYAAGARYGTEGTAAPGEGIRWVFLVGVALTSIGLALLGMFLLGRPARVDRDRASDVSEAEKRAAPRGGSGT